MPVEDHATHPSTKIGKDYRHGCWNLPRPSAASGYWAPDRRYFPDGRWEATQVWVLYDFSTECRYDGLGGRERCEGCEHFGTGVEYNQRIRREGK